jgi:hypothetical protein
MTHRLKLIGRQGPRIDALRMAVFAPFQARTIGAAAALGFGGRFRLDRLRAHVLLAERRLLRRLLYQRDAWTLLL